MTRLRFMLRTALALWVLLSGAASAWTASAQGVVVPSGQANVEGDTSRAGAPFGFGGAGARFMQIYDAAAFGAGGPVRILGLRFRPDVSVGSAAARIFYADVEVRLSTTSVGVDALGTTFDANVGADETLVREGPLSLSTSNLPVSPGPTKAFDVHLPLQPDFAYDPSDGNLLVEIRTHVPGGLGALDAQTDPSGASIRMLTSEGSGSATTGSLSASGLVTRFDTIPDGVLVGSSEPLVSTYTISQKTGLATLIGPTGFPLGGPAALASDPATGRVWGLRNSSTALFDVDLETGEFIQIGFGPPLLSNPGLAYDPAADLLYATHQLVDFLYSIDPATGLKTAIGMTPPDVSGVAYDPDNEILYASSSATDLLYILDPATGAGTVVGPLGFDAGTMGLAYDVYDDILYMTDRLTDTLYIVDVTTGAATAVGSPGVDNVLGLTYVPEPGRAVGLLVGAIACGAFRRLARSERSS